MLNTQWRSQYGGKGGRESPLTAKKSQKLGKRGKKSGKSGERGGNQEKMGEKKKNREEKAKIGKVLSLYPS